MRFIGSGGMDLESGWLWVVVCMDVTCSSDSTSSFLHVNVVARKPARPREPRNARRRDARSAATPTGEDGSASTADDGGGGDMRLPERNQLLLC